METKTCKTCGCIKPLNEFRPEHNQCKQCYNNHDREYRAEHREQDKEHNRQWCAKHFEHRREERRKWYVQHPDEVKIIRANDRHNRRAKTKGQRITLAEWTAIKQQQRLHCFWCKGKFKDEELTIDHVISLKRGGLHDSSNIVAACQPCNSKKHISNWSLL
jgi:5-methylcytosine-specific restriction endonuclease McrA